MWFLSAFAVYFIIWWTVLFAVLPIGLRTQEEENDVVLGTVESAPARFQGGRVVLLTTLISAVIYGLWLTLSTYFGITMTWLVQVMPNYR